MIKFIFLLASAFFISLCLQWKKSTTRSVDSAASTQELINYKATNAIGCAPENTEGSTDNALSIPLLSGWGNHQFKISTQSDSTQAYFNQGINMFYGFHFIEARASFKKAQEFDSLCAMAYLGEVLAYGPTINNPAYKQRRYVLDLMEKASRNASRCTPLERALIEAQAIRYTMDTTEGFQKVNEAYADAMKNVYANFSSNADAGSLYADALMQLHPWDLYDNQGRPRDWTARIEAEITKLLKRFPEHPALNHYYIHCVESSNTASRGLSSARKMSLLTPGLSHMVHMSSHIYVRTGDYNKGVQSNEKAREAYEQYKNDYPDVQRGSMLYYQHALSMEFANALLLPNYKGANSIAHLKRSHVPVELSNSKAVLSMGAQYNYCFPLLAWVRYGKWDSILAEPKLPEHLIYGRYLQHFAKGIALARKHKTEEAILELQAMESSVAHPDLRVHGLFENAPEAGAKVAFFVLKGVIAEEEGRMTDAVSDFTKAVEQEDAMQYNEPKDWLLPARHYLGDALFSAKQYERAESVFRKDLKINPKNVWSLIGLQNALIKQKKIGASFTNQRLREVLVASDVKIKSAVF